MSSKRAMRQAQKQSYAKHRSNIISNRFQKKKFELLIRKRKNIKNLFSLIFIYKK